MAFGLIEDQLRNPFDGRVAIEKVDWLSQLLERSDQRIVVAQDHLVIQLSVNPAFDDALDVAEIAHHVPAVERTGSDLDLGDGVVTVRVLADPVIIEQPVAITEFDALGDGVHSVVIDYSAVNQIIKSPNHQAAR